MGMMRNSTYGYWRYLVVAMIATLSAGLAGAQSMSSVVSQTLSEPDFIYEFQAAQHADFEPVPQSATPRLRMFGMPAGFLATPVGLDDEDDPKLVQDPYFAALKKDDDLRNVQIALGMDNPFFDLRRPGGIGGVGYYQIYSQVQIIETGATSMCVNLQSFTPAGVQSGGLANGPSYVCPSLSVFHELGMKTAVQAYVGQNISSGAGWDDNWNRKTHYGMAWQCPLGLDRDRDNNLYFFVQALGHFNYDPGRTGHPAMMVLPGIQWRLADNCWLSFGGNQHSLLSCSWKF
jgi:hypothetical protein